MELDECKIGQRVYVSEDLASDWGNKADRETTILGIDNGWIIVYKSNHGYDVMNTTDCKTYSDAWRIHPHILKLLKDLPRINPYPNICKLCKAPARKVNKITLCSRDRCKSKSEIKKYGKPVIQKIANGVDQDNYAICPTCNTRAINVSYFGGLHRNTCNNSHTWRHDWLDGQKLADPVVDRKYYYLYRYNKFTMVDI